MLADRDVVLIPEVAQVSYNRWFSSLSETWTLNDTPLPKSRRRLSADGLIQVIRNRLAHVQDKRRSTSVSYSMVDSLMAAFALFSLARFSLKGSLILCCWPFRFVRGGRIRWRIENETFNTLKNQGYHFEHKAKGSWKCPSPLRKRGTNG